jgi:DNA-binding MarR family transcriptional regulator
MGKPFYKLDSFGCFQSIGYLNRRLQNLLLPRVEALFAHEDLTFSHWVSLMALREGLATTAAELARHMNHDTGATTRLIDQLEERGLLKRTRSSADRRVVNLALTQEGRAVAKSLTPLVMDYWNDVLGEFSHAEVATLISLLTRLGDRIEAADAAPEKKRASR